MTTLDRNKGYSEADYQSIIAGDVEIPNFEPMTPESFCQALAAGGHSMTPKWGHAKGDGAYKAWAQYFLTNFSNMGNKPDGSGYVCVYGMKAPKVGRFAICKHEKQDSAGANHSRGWHPGHCVKCGLDMTIDSGD